MDGFDGFEAAGHTVGGTRLFARTGWTIVSVPGLVPDDIFFDHLSKRRFPAGNFIRSADSLDVPATGRSSSVQR